jgi:hypothetical protein
MVRLIDADAALPCCGIKSPAHPGRCEKLCWLEANSGYGLRAKTLLAPDGHATGYIEYVPGEFAWRAVDAGGYLFIHCLWISRRKDQGRGWGRLMVEACLEDAKRAGKRGVAVAVREGPWMADRRLFVANGFRTVDAAPPDYELLVRKFDDRAADPAFQGGWDGKLRRYGRGLTIIRCGQCPHIAKFADDIAGAARTDYGIEPEVVHLRSPAEAQDAPTPYAVFAVIRDGQLLADHPISRTRFRNIMNQAGK